MKMRIPGRNMSVRFFERVETVDSQYDIFDIGVEQEDGSVDSMVVGGSFSFVKSLSADADKKAAKKAAKKEAKEAKKAAAVAASAQAAAEALAAQPA